MVVVYISMPGKRTFPYCFSHSPCFPFILSFSRAANKTGRKKESTEDASIIGGVASKKKSGPKPKLAAEAKPAKQVRFRVAFSLFRH
jgi:hypothetical protein